MRAALLWGSLTDQESETSCHDCARNVSNTSCRAFFESNAGLDGHKQAERARRRRRALTQAGAGASWRRLPCAFGESVLRALQEPPVGARALRRQVLRAAHAALGRGAHGAHAAPAAMRAPGRARAEPQHLVGVDLLAPLTLAVLSASFHADARGRNAMLGPSGEECMARSIALPWRRRTVWIRPL